jgi:membrane associated rhomboid family serine protease
MIPIRNAVPSRYPPVVTWILIATNCLVFLFQDSLSPDELELFLRQFALIPARYSEAFASSETDLAAVDFVPFFTMMFLHGGCPTHQKAPMHPHRSTWMRRRSTCRPWR